MNIINCLEGYKKHVLSRISQTIRIVIDTTSGLIGNELT